MLDIFEILNKKIKLKSVLRPHVFYVFFFFVDLIYTMVFKINQSTRIFFECLYFVINALLINNRIWEADLPRIGKR